MPRVKKPAQHISSYTKPPPADPSHLFQHLCICMCGTLSMSHDELSDVLIEHGATVVSSITKRCNTLITTSRELEKQSRLVKKAITKNSSSSSSSGSHNSLTIQIINEDYVHECIRKGNTRSVDINRFLLTPTTTTTTTTTNSNNSNNNNNSHSTTIVPIEEQKQTKKETEELLFRPLNMPTVDLIHFNIDFIT